MEKYNVTGMTCSACQAHVEKAVNKVPGVEKVEVSLLTNSMQVEGTASSEEIIKAVVSAGYGASLYGAAKNKPQDDSLSEENSEVKIMIRRLVLSVIFLVILMYISMGHNMLGWWVPSPLVHNHIGLATLQMLLCIIIMYINKKFFVSGTKSVLNGAPNMDTLVAMGSGVSFLWSLFVFFKMTVMVTNGAPNMELMDLYHNSLYFESAATIPALITVGKTLEAYSKGRTTDALKALMKLAPNKANVEREGTITEVSIEEVVVGDIVVVKPGESFPVDGDIIEGTTSADESALTGESMPVDKTVGDSVSAATINTTGYVKIRATKVGGDTAFSKIVQMVTDASSSKAPIARIADKVSGVFVPAVIVIAFSTMICWLTIGHATTAVALEHAIAVLVISCPCALGLATPVAIMVGNGVGARHGILFKTGESLENAGRIKTVVFDKTGTITEGSPEVTDVIAFGASKEDLLKVASAVESRSEHPLAKAVVAYAGSSSCAVTDYEALPGNGLRAKVDGKEVVAGSSKFIESVITLSEEQKDKVNALSEQGKTPMLFVEEGKLLGIIAASDVIKSDSKDAITKLNSMGIKTVMLTGDNERVAKAIAAQAGISEVIAEVLPDAKAEAVDKYKQSGKVAMVGDGINDAPALTSADTGMAIGAGTDVAIDSADVVLMGSHLTDVVNAVRLSKATLRNIHQNLFWAFGYNVLLIPMAAGVYPGIHINPMWGAAAMALSSFCVCMNALRLNLIKLEKIEEENKKQIIKTEEIKMEKTIVIEGMMCPMCEKHTREALSDMAGVEVKSVSHQDNKAVVEITGDVTDEALMATVNGAGYKAIEVK
ncbi:MAG: cadmium-translocating P-type ATPase [Saccharofermentans sp.]|nr:cadmium-translocating P-type ATPase [Saccharofermentans sp.]